jgi:hypothetical protein
MSDDGIKSGDVIQTELAEGALEYFDTAFL